MATSRDRSRAPDVVRGTISSASFGDEQIVVGCWSNSPIGPIGDVMWSRPDGSRWLLTSSQREADFICSIYAFDDVRLGPLRVTSDGTTTVVDGQGLAIELVGGRAIRLPPRPRWFTRWCEAPVAKAVMGVHTYGTSPLGRREWYQATALRWVRHARATVDGIHYGNAAPLARPMKVGFSDPPRSPSIVTVKVAIGH